MNNILQTVKDAAIKLLAGYNPEVDVYGEEILRTDGALDIEEGRDGLTWYFVEVIPTAFLTAGPDMTEVSLTVSIDYHEPGETFRGYGEQTLALDKLLRPVFRFVYAGERRAVTVERISSNISGGMLHLTVPLTFLIANDREEYPPMEELETSIKRG